MNDHVCTTPMDRDDVTGIAASDRAASDRAAFERAPLAAGSWPRLAGCVRTLAAASTFDAVDAS